MLNDALSVEPLSHKADKTKSFSFGKIVSHCQVGFVEFIDLIHRHVTDLHDPGADHILMFPADIRDVPAIIEIIDFKGKVMQIVGGRDDEREGVSIIRQGDDFKEFRHDLIRVE